MTCDCTKHIQMRKEGAKHIKCARNSRKLRGAWDFIGQLADTMESRAHTLTDELCEGDHVVYTYVRDMLLITSTYLRQRFRYLSLVPWCFSNTDTVVSHAFA